ncbi:MAG TPA: protein-methionine-sulfoxide reductase heme-binding subunit MsrQ [Burkholderiaceae bacterium]|nr:protein-methionine-sulfoxide reductase heme-binding subunit MsrQ [Burkholderiaceae bacterium]
MKVNVRMLSPRAIAIVKTLVWLAALIPFARLAMGVAHEALGPNPIETLQRTTGWYALVLLCVALGVTPARRLLGWPWLARLRRLLGLFAFFYAVLHFVTWVWFDHFFDVAELTADVIKRPFITVGFLAFVLLIPLAATSTHRATKWLGAKRWQALHRSVYAIAPLAVLHYWWHKAGKNDLAYPALFAVIVAVLLALRVWWRWQSTTTKSPRVTT